MTEPTKIGEHIIDCLMEDKVPESDPVLQEWLEEKESNRDDLMKYRKIWKETGRLAGIRKYDSDRAWRRINRAHRKREAIRRRLKNTAYVITGMAASVLVLLAISPMFLKTPAVSMPAIAIEMKTNYGNRSEITLPDGTNVKLNAGSQILYRLDEENRVREVNFKGEGFFNVAKSDMPFVVNTPGEFHLKVLGTTFNLSAYEDDSSVSTSLLEGSVELYHSGGRLVLTAGQAAIYDKATRIIEYSNEELSYSYGWLNNKLYMENMPLTDVCKYLERWYDVDITIEKEIGSKIHYSGVLKEETIKDVLDALSRLSRIKYKMKGKKVTISQK